MKNKVIVVLLVVVNCFGYIFLKDNIGYSNSDEVISYNSDYEIGSINISSINLNRKLMQGLDNKYYLNHDYLNVDSDKGEFFLDTFGDLLNGNNPIIYSNINNLDINSIRINDLVNIRYIDYNYCYKVLSINRNVKYDLIIKLIGDNKTYNIFLLKVEC